LEDLKVYRARIQYRIKKSKKEKKDDDGEKGGHLWVRSFVCKDVQNELEQIKMSELKCITLTPDGKGVVYTEKDGECYWTSPIGWDLGEELKKSTKDRYPITINMGTEERYFIKYSNGDVMVHGNEELKEFVKIGDVKMIAFGIEFDSFAVLYEDGGSAWSFVPKALRCLLANRPGNTPSSTATLNRAICRKPWINAPVLSVKSLSEKAIASSQDSRNNSRISLENNTTSYTEGIYLTYYLCYISGCKE